MTFKLKQVRSKVGFDALLNELIELVYFGRNCLGSVFYGSKGLRLFVVEVAPNIGQVLIKCFAIRGGIPFVQRLQDIGIGAELRENTRCINTACAGSGPGFELLESGAGFLGDELLFTYFAGDEHIPLVDTGHPTVGSESRSSTGVQRRI